MKYIIILLFIFLVIIKLYKPKTKGEIGEYKVNKKLKNFSNYLLLKDILLPTETGTTQIDHILIGKKGVFVIETKNYNGWIYGDERSQYWTQVLYNTKNKFYNPIKQNYAHVKAIERILPSKYKKMIYSVIVFSNKSDLMKISVSTPVIKIKDIKRFIRKFYSDDELTADNIEYIYKVLEHRNITDKRTRKNHVNRIKMRVNKGSAFLYRFSLLIAIILLIGIADNIVNNSSNCIVNSIFMIIALANAIFWRANMLR